MTPRGGFRRPRRRHVRRHGPLHEPRRPQTRIQEKSMAGQGHTIPGPYRSPSSATPSSSRSRLMKTLAPMAEQEPGVIGSSKPSPDAGHRQPDRGLRLLGNALAAIGDQVDTLTRKGHDAGDAMLGIGGALVGAGFGLSVLGSKSTSARPPTGRYCADRGHRAIKAWTTTRRASMEAVKLQRALRRHRGQDRRAPCRSSPMRLLVPAGESSHPVVHRHRPRRRQARGPH